MRKGVLTAVALGSFLVCTLCVPAWGTTYHEDYGTYDGSTITFQNVTETSSTSSVALFGSPLVAGNSLEFSPTDFGASAQQGSSQFSSTLIDTLITGTGQNSIDQIVLDEGGDYTLIGARGTSKPTCQFIPR